MTMEKTIEESKQGESLVIENKAQNSKKLFIESLTNEELKLKLKVNKQFIY